MDGTTNAIEVKDLVRIQGSFRLNSISFNLHHRSITGFIGINGAGKTTTIKLLLGLIKKQSGNITVFGKDLDTNKKEISNRVGFVLDEGGFYENLTLLEMKKIISYAYTSWDDIVFFEYMDKLKLNKKQKVATLSKGMRMKYALAIALSHHAELLILDEPTSGLDPLVRNEILCVLQDYVRSNNSAIFFSTHITSDLERIADDIVFMHSGNVLYNGTFSDMGKTLCSKSVELYGEAQRKNKSIEQIMIDLLGREDVVS